MRAYLDHNATTPLRPEARDAMLRAMDVVGNPSSVHAEGRAAKSLIEAARAQVAAALGADGADVIFTSGATEAAALALAGRGLQGAEIEHEAVAAWVATDLPVDRRGQVTVIDPAQTALQLANSETGVIQTLPEGLAVSDMTQGFGKLPLSFNWTGCTMALVSAHKLGGPKGIGALVIRRGTDLAAQLRGGNLTRARILLEALVASTSDEARAVQPYAKSLLEQVTERQRLDAANVKLTQQLERSSQQLKDSQARADELQRKLDALADIERSLPPARIPSRGVPR